MDLLHRLHDNLAAACRSRGSDRVLTIGEIYQHLIPYRAIRGELGIWELAQYEHALLRLLAGEGGYVIAPAAVRAELARELASPNPILGVYRDYAGVAVELGSGAVPPGPPPTPSSPSRAVPPAPDSGGGAASCRGCGSALPEVEGLKYCPRCGADQRDVNCPSCAASMRPEWRFCVRCGNAR